MISFNRSNAFLTGTLATVRAYDPKLFARMIKDTFNLRDDDGQHIVGLFPMHEWLTASKMLHEGSLGATVSDSKPNAVTDTPEVWLNVRNIRRRAFDWGLPVELVAAFVLAHEYEHTHQTSTDQVECEIPAYAAGSAFADKVGGRAGAILRKYSEDTCEQVRRNGGNFW